MSQKNTAKLSLLGLDRTELALELEKIGEKPFRAKQLWHWIYNRGETNFKLMTTIAKPLQQKLSELYVVGRPKLSKQQKSKDTSHKWLLKFRDGSEAETVFIPEDGRGALCLSSQIGCTLTCTFCHTGTQRLVRNLNAEEIVGQLMLARDAYKEWPSQKGERLFSNIVMMGMGEPLFNYENVAKALHIIMDGDGIAISKRRITLSTSGVVPLIRKCGAELGVNLAISLHAVNDELRNEIMPINKKYPLKQLLQACREYPGANNSRRITFEYVMLRGINDSTADARELLRMVKGIPAKFNLIPFNKWPGAEYECSTSAAIKRFSEILNDGGYTAPIRTPRGRDILAACGQLKSSSKTSKFI
ncbi:MAG: 23S rRNA (adenine(2503)-C(2))-methyltransferase RlmN [Magnetovibrio sp.]|nr:23S rRNA (adenine(2503)-C(2))-methyltransferase RlmN [Magnetovibrio sp.]